MNIAIMIALWLGGAVVVYLLFARGQEKAARMLFGGAVILTGIAFIAAGIMGGRSQREFQDILTLFIAPGLLGMAIGFYVGKTRSR